MNEQEIKIHQATIAIMEAWKARALRAEQRCRDQAKEINDRRHRENRGGDKGAI